MSNDQHRYLGLTAGILSFLLVFSPIAPVFAEETAPIPSDAAPVLDTSTTPEEDGVVTDPTDPSLGIQEGQPQKSDKEKEDKLQVDPTDSKEKDKDAEKNTAAQQAAVTSSAAAPAAGASAQVNSPTRARFTTDVDSLTGALTYKYKIDIPPGRNGLAPDLSIVYNSANTSNDSVVGFGWDFNLPYIQRINKTGTNNLYRENYYSSVMDGELISLGSGNFGAKDENGTFNKYSLVNNTWTVTDKTGVIYKFGSTSSTRQDNPDGTKIFKWLLEEVRDTSNNFISYEYYKDAGQIYPSKITYTGNGVTGGIFTANFSREARANPPNFFSTGFSVKSNYRINEIRTEISGTWARRYSISYTTADNGSGSLLNTITETGQDDAGDTTTLPAIDFDYKTSTPGWTYNPGIELPLWFINNSDKDSGARIGDINGDGLLDIVCHNDITTSDICNKSNPQVYINNGSGWTNSSAIWLLPAKVDRPNERESFLDNNLKDRGLRLMDVNGDGRDDLVRGYSSGDYVYLNNGSGWTYNPAFAFPSWFANSGNDTGLRTADINGDGLPDVICHNDLITSDTCNRSNPRIYLNNGAGWTNVSTTWLLPPMADAPNKTEVFLDGSLRDTGLRIFDINGDGLADLMRGVTTGTYFVYLNNGSGWTYDPTLSYAVKFIYNGGDTGTRLGDINGDGLIDALCHNDITDAQYCNQQYPFVYINDGAKSWIPVSGTWPFPPMVDAPTKKEAFLDNRLADRGLRIIDVNGDGLDDLVRGYYAKNYVYLNNGNTQSNLLTRISYPEGGNTIIAYKATPLYKDGSNKLLNPTLPIKFNTVSQITNNDGVGTTDTYNYIYAGGAYYFSSNVDKKFAGFNSVTKTDGDGNVTKTFYHQGNSSDSTHGEYSDHISKLGKAYRVEVYDNANNLYSKTINKWDKYDLGSGRNFVKMAQRVTSSYDGDASHRDIAEALTYENTYGNLTQKIEFGEVVGSDDGTFTDYGTDDFTTNLDYSLNFPVYVVGLPKQNTVTDHNNAKVKESRYYYDAGALGVVTKGNLTKEENWVSGSAYVNAQKTYNSTYGTIASIIDPRGKTTFYTNDAYNIYPASIANPLGQTNSFVYDYSSGRSKQKTDQNNRVWQWQYDGLDRLVAEKEPDLATPSTLATKSSYIYTDTLGGVNIHKTDNLDGSTARETYQYFDGLGRLIQQRMEAEGGNYEVADKVYNNRGFVQKESLPYFSSGANRTSATGTNSLYNNYSYDSLARVSSITNNVGTTTNTYSDWKLAVTDPNGKTKDLYKNAYGNLVEVDGHDGGSTYSTYYTYNYLTNLTKLTDALGNIRNFTYDGLGRRLTAEDLHAPADSTYGTWVYTYDEAGNLAGTSDPKGQNIAYTYDDVNRVLTENYAGQVGTEATYTYDSGTDGIGQLTGITSSALTQANTYNPVGGLKSESKVINSTTYTTNYDYDRLGNQLSITNPDGSIVKYNYNTAGLLNSVQRKEATDASYINLVSNIDYSPTEQPTSILYQNGATTTNAYDSNKLYRLSTKATTISGGSRAQDLSYTYDSVGNITKIVDASATSASKTANYTYDDLYRLTQAAATSVAPGQSTYVHNYTYNAIGNLLTRTDAAGAYSYAGTSYANPHAATSIGSVTYNYDNNGNITNDGTWTNTWDYNNRIIQSTKTGTTVTYDYDSSGQRIKYSNGPTTTYYPTKFYNTDGNNPKKHIFALGMEVGVVNGTGSSAAVRYIHSDHLSGANIVTNASNGTDEVMDYFPFGNVRIDSGTYNEQRKYIGQEHDADTGLEYLNARYYNAANGQFISEDPMFWSISSDWLKDPQNQNSYAYGRNNPITMSDPTGNYASLIMRPIPGIPGAHGFISITPEQGSDLDGSHYTIGGYPSKGLPVLNKLQAQINNSYDFSYDLSKSLGIISLSPPKGMSVAQYDHQLLKSGENLSKTDLGPYVFTGRPGSAYANSGNTFTQTILDAGGTVPKIPNVYRATTGYRFYFPLGSGNPMATPSYLQQAENMIQISINKTIAATTLMANKTLNRFNAMRFMKYSTK